MIILKNKKFSEAEGEKEDKNKFYNKASATGLTIAGLGGLSLVSPKIALNLVKKLRKQGKSVNLDRFSSINKSSKVLKKSGPLLIGSGLAVTGLSEFKRRKDNKNDNSEK